MFLRPWHAWLFASLALLVGVFLVALGRSAGLLLALPGLAILALRARPGLPSRPGWLAGSGATVALFGAATAWLARDVTPLAALALASGFFLVALHAHWSQRAARPEIAGWEAPLLALVVVAMASVTMLYAAALLGFPGRGVALRVAALAGVAALPMLLSPPPLTMPRGALFDAFAHGLAGIALLNALLLGFSLVSGWSLRAVFALLFAWQLVVIGMDYRTLRHADRRRRAQRPAAPPPSARGDEITLVVPAANEAALLPDTLARNLAAAPGARVILVPATKSKDDTVAVAHALAARDPERIRVVEGTTGSKAEDLNLAWRDVRTPFVLLLDADETTDAGSLAGAMAILDARPEVGVVQGRKVSRSPDQGALARFVSAERRYCTWMDHVMHGEVLGSAHFGGSAALLRAEVPRALGGWSERTMTEDIEFTLRLHLDDRWKIAYEPSMIVREADPATFADLVRQRTRWSRGWAQCFALYFGDVLRARRRLGGKRAFGLAWLLLITVSALWTTFVPASLLLRLAGASPLLPVVVGFPLTLLLLPGRLLTYGYAALRDPVIPMRFSVGGFGELALHAYLWILMGWFVQLHALYLELSRAPRVWHVTGKRAIAGA